MFDLFAAFSLHSHVDTAVRATLADGQILMGEVRTKVLRLASGAGELDVPLADVGEVVPVRGAHLGSAEGQVNVWLRNGSELKGRWADPALAMGILVGGAAVGIDLPMNELTRFQLQTGEAWPTEAVYRMKTSFGDDFLVDPARTRVQLDNQLGSFAPVLTECRSVAPIGDPEGDWRIELQTGTVLVGKLHDSAVTVALPMGPKEVTVPLKNFVSLRMERWEPVPLVPLMPAYRPADDAPPSLEAPARMDEVSMAAPYPTPAETPARHSSKRSGPNKRPTPSAAPAPAARDPWFDSAGLQSSKQAEDAAQAPPPR